MLTTWFHQRLTATPRSPRQPRGGAWGKRLFRPRLEALEDRLAPATVTWGCLALDPFCDGKWSNPHSWAEGRAPEDGDDLVFPLNDQFFRLRDEAINDIPDLRVRSITARDSYTLTGDRIELGEGGISVLFSEGYFGAQLSVDLDVRLIGSGAGSAVVNVDPFRRLNIRGSVSGTVGLTKQGIGDLRLGGANTYSGSTTVTRGVVSIASGSALGATGSGNETFVSSGGTLEIVTNVLGETLQLEGTGSGDLGALHAATTSALWSGPLTLGSSSTSVSVTGGGSLFLIGTLSGTGGLQKRGRGTLVLSNANDYVGATTVSEGVLNVRHASALGGTENDTFVDPGAELQLEGGIIVTAEALTLFGDGSAGRLGTLRNVSGNNTWGRAVTLAGDSILGTLAGSLTVNGSLRGVGGLRKTGAGSLILSNANTYTGTTTVSEGVLNVRHADALGGIANDIRVESGATLELEGGVSILGQSLTLLGAGVGLTGALRNRSGNNSWGGTITLGAAGTIGSQSGTLTVTGNISLGDFVLTVTGTGDTVLGGAGVLSGLFPSGLSKTGTGTLTLTGTGVNTYLGLTRVSEGVLNIQKANALGGGGDETTVGDLGILELQGGIRVGEPLIFSVTNRTTPRLRSRAGANTWSGLVSLSQTVSVAVDADQLTLDGMIGGDPGAGLTKEGLGTLELAGDFNNTYSGTTRVNAGTLVLNKRGGISLVQGALVVGDGSGTDTVRLARNDQLSDTAAVTVNASGVLDLDGRSDTIGPLTMTGGRVRTGSGRLTLNGDVTASSAVVVPLFGALPQLTPATIDGTLFLGNVVARRFAVNRGLASADLVIDVAIPSGGTAGLTKTGAGVLELRGANSYVGPTTVEAGRLVVNGSQPDSRAVVRGTLTGAGTVGGITSLGGTVSPTSGATLTSKGDVALDAASTFSALVVPHPISPVASQLRVEGTVALNSARLELSTVFLTSARPGTSLRVIDNDRTEAVTGTFRNLPEGATVAVRTATFISGQPVTQTQSYRVSYKGGDGNDVTLSLIELGPSFPGTYGDDVRHGDRLEHQADALEREVLLALLQGRRASPAAASQVLLASDECFARASAPLF